MSNRPKRNNSNNTTLKLITASIAIAGAAYGTYKYLSSFTPQIINQNRNEDSIIDETDSNPLKFKQKEDTSISLVISKTVLDKISEYNENHEDGIDIQNYLKNYKNLVIILYPGLTFKDLENYFEIDEINQRRILQTSVEDSIFHLLKQLGSSINLVCFKDFNKSKEDIDKEFRLENILSNVISLDNLQFVTFI